MEDTGLFRKTSMDRIRSPEQLNDYLRVTNPAVWVLLAALLLLLAGLTVWASFTYVGSFADGSAQVSQGVMTIRFEDESTAKNVEPGMTVQSGEVTATVSSVGEDRYGDLFALAETTLADGSYQVRVCYKQTQILKLLFN